MGCETLVENLDIEFPVFECCKENKMVISLASKDKIDKILWSTYRDLCKYNLPIKKYVKFGEKSENYLIVEREIKSRLKDVHSTWLRLQEGEAWTSDMVKMISDFRRVKGGEEGKFMTPFFTPSNEDLKICKEEMPFFGFYYKITDIIAKLFLYDIVLSVSPIFAMQKRFRIMYKKLNNLKEVPYTMDNPDVFIQKAVLQHSIRNVIEYIGNKNCSITSIQNKFRTK